MRAQLISREDITDDTPLRLDVAAKLAFPDGSIGLSSLRREAARGTLQVWRVAGKHMTSLAAIRKMLDQCLVTPSPPDSGSGQPLTIEKPSGSSSTAAVRSARDAAKMRAEKLKLSSPPTSPPSTILPHGGTVIPMKSR
jgi:hypothetical protein